MDTKLRQGPAPKRYKTQTMQLAFQDICSGEQPWVALGIFMNYWFCNAKDRREMLVSEPIQEAPANEHCQHWAAFCAASVEYLCRKYEIPCSQWVHNPKYHLLEAWYHLPRYDVPTRIYTSLIASTPEEYSKRNIYVSDNVFDNKWEFMERWKEKLERVKQLSQEEREIYRKTGKMPV